MPSRAMSRLLWVTFFVLIAVFAMRTHDTIDSLFARTGKLETRVDAEAQTLHLLWRGKIEAPMLDRLSEAFDKHAGEVKSVVLSLSSPGGALDHGSRVVRLLDRIKQTHRLETIVEARRICASMCVPVFLQGDKRSAAENARFMFHEVSFRESISSEELDVPGAAKASATDRLFQRYFKPAGVPDDWVRTVRAQMSGGNDVWKTARELTDEDSRIVEQVF